MLVGKDLHAPETARSVRFAGIAAFCSSERSCRREKSSSRGEATTGEELEGAPPFLAFGKGGDFDLCVVTGQQAIASSPQT